MFWRRLGLATMTSARSPTNNVAASQRSLKYQHKPPSTTPQIVQICTLCFIFIIQSTATLLQPITMNSALILTALAVLFVEQALAQTTTGGRECWKNADCPQYAFCRMYDFYQYPAMWPACPHYGYCVCNDNYVQITNGSCVPIVNLNLYDKCSNQVYERYLTPQQRCDGSKVVCNTPTYVDRQGYCDLAPVPTAAPVPVVIPAVPTCSSVGFLSFCDSKQCCAAGSGLTCQQRGSNSTYSQCLCSVKTSIYDQGLGYCRPRIYGDACTADDECASNLISNTGFECRLGRCRCKTGFEPVDNQFWNETARATYRLRICISSGAVSWVPTGQSCSMDPHMFAGLNSTRVCHPRAFCHLCYKQRGAAGYSYSSTLTAAVVGTCREMNCGNDGDCGNQGRCNNWGITVDPPCERGMCDCNWNQGFYKDRFSRCALYQPLNLGDRCISPDTVTQLHPWYINNEDWTDDRVCVASDKQQGGYAGYNWGVVKCKLPLIEDADGNCVPNDDQRYQWYQWLNYNDYCDDTDNRLPLKRCDTTRGLSCISNKCQCPTTSTCASGYGGCNAVGTSASVNWDGNTCRNYGGASDACKTSSDCCGGSCNNGYCGCATGLTLVDYSTGVSINNGGNGPQFSVSTRKYCFKNFTYVQKGGECQLDPTTWNCGQQRYGFYQNFVPSLVCSPGLVCMRCPQDYSHDDEAYGICRAVSQSPAAQPPPVKPCFQGNQGGNQGGVIGGNQGGVIGGNGGNVGPGGVIYGRWSNWRNAAPSTVAQTIVVAVLVLIAALF